MYQIEEVNCYEREIDTAVLAARRAIRQGNAEMTITDTETGEVMFSYFHGNVDYIQGDFALKMIG